MKKPVTVAITGAAGNIGYAIAFRIAAGNLFGPDQPVNLNLIEIEPALPVLTGVVMELKDCAFPTLNSVLPTADPSIGFGDADYVFLIGARPRGKGMERQDLLSANGAIFKPTGKAISDNAANNVRVLVVGNPANTNALITLHNAPNLQPNQITSMMRLDHNRTISMLADHVSAHSTEIKNVTVWGNHSITQFPDLQHCSVGQKNAYELIDQDWYQNHFIERVQKRGAEIIEARGSSSAASAASAAIDHMHDWICGSASDSWISMGTYSKGQYGLADNLMYSFPTNCGDGEYQVITDLELNDYSKDMIALSEKELIKERELL
ncbi:MAG: malate dehydrogenase, partial [Pseudomonadota bacterium]